MVTERNRKAVQTKRHLDVNTTSPAQCQARTNRTRKNWSQEAGRLACHLVLSPMSMPTRLDAPQNLSTASRAGRWKTEHRREERCGGSGAFLPWRRGTVVEMAGRSVESSVRHRGEISGHVICFERIVVDISQLGLTAHVIPFPTGYWRQLMNSRHRHCLHVLYTNHCRRPRRSSGDCSGDDTTP